MKAAAHTLVVGGTRGIGRAVVRHFLAAGHAVSVMGRRDAAEFGAARVHPLRADLADHAALPAVLDGLVRRHGCPDNLVFLQRYRGEGDAWQGEFDVSVTATRIVVEQLTGRSDHRPQSVVFVCSHASHLVAEEQPVGYHAAKAALRQMARFYAVALGPAGVRFNCVTPGAVLKEESRDYYLRNRRLQSLYRRVTPLGRMGTAEEVAACVGFLCSPDASFVTGQDLAVDGGLSLLWQESLARRVAGPARPAKVKSKRTS